MKKEQKIKNIDIMNVKLIEIEFSIENIMTNMVQKMLRIPEIFHFIPYLSYNFFNNISILPEL